MYIGAIDVGGTKTMAGLVDGSGRLLLSKQIPTQTASPALHFQRCAQLLREVTAQYGIPFSSLEGVGVSLPGTVDESHQVLTMAPGSGWRDLPAAQMLREQLGHQLLWCDNDVNNCARAELRFAGAPADFLWITVSTGIGGAVVAGGRVILGCGSLSGELGHYKVELQNPRPCPCGSAGCLEAYASGAAIGRQFAQLAREDPETGRLAQEGGLPLDAAGCAALAKAGHQPALQLFQQAGRYLGETLAPVVSVLNPARIYLGGGVSRSFDLLVPAIEMAIQTRAAESCAQLVKLQPTSLGYEASLLGAAALFLEQAGR